MIGTTREVVLLADAETRRLKEMGVTVQPRTVPQEEKASGLVKMSSLYIKGGNAYEEKIVVGVRFNFG